MSPASYQTAPPRDDCRNLPFTDSACPESGKRDSNPRPQPWQGCALPTELFPPERPPQAASSLASAHHSRNAHGHRENGGEGDRTPDLVNAIHALSQLSYAPVIYRPALGVSRPRRRGSTET